MPNLKYNPVMKKDLDLTNVNVAANTSRLSDLAINVKGLGCTGDGITDDTTAMQNAFNLANTKGSLKLYFPEGTYITKARIRLYKNTTVEMHPNAIIKRMGGTTQTNMFVNGEYGNLTYATGYNGDGNIHFKGGTIDLNTIGSPLNTVNSNLSAFDLGHAENLTFKGMTIKNGQNGHYFQISSCRQVLIEDCWIGSVNYTNNTGSYDFECIQIEEATSVSFPPFGGYDGTISRDITIQNCVLDGVVRVTGTHSYPRDIDGVTPLRYCENIQIINNVFRNILDDCIHLEAFKNVKILNNVFDTIGKYGIHTYRSSNLKIENNVGYNIQQSALYMEYTDNSKTNKNYWKDSCITSGFSAIRISFSNNNILSDDIVTVTSTPYHQYAMYFSDSSNNVIRGFDFTKGYGTKDKGGIAGVGSQLASQFFGAKSQVLYDGDLTAIGNTYTFNDDLRAFSQIIIIGNNNSTATSSIVSMTIPSLALVFGTTVNQFRFMPSPSTTASYIQFHFDTDVNNLHTITLDDVQGSCHIRKIIGIR
jgi:polygalacturonase